MKHQTQANKNKIIAFALLGYSFIFLAIFSLFGSIALLIYLSIKNTAFLLLLFKKKLILIILPALGIFTRALWVSIPPPDGLSISPKEAPELFKVINELRKQLASLKIHEVIITADSNAAVVQIPRFGIFGWHRNYLILGLEFLLTLNSAEAKAVIAHEMGHLSGNHSRFGAWIYRARLSWHRILAAFNESQHFGAKLIQRFFSWYYPKLNQLSFSLARSNEYEADQISVELTDRQSTANALIKAHAVLPYLDSHYWEHYIKLADTHDEPPYTPFQGMKVFLAKEQHDHESIQAYLTQAMEVETNQKNTHPALKDRLQAIGITEATVPPLDNGDAAQQWLGQSFEDVLQHYDQRWMDAHKNKWKERHQYATEAKQKLKELQSRPVDELDDDELWDLAAYTHEFVSVDQVVPLLEQYMVKHPNDAAAAYALGRIHYDDNNDKTLDYFQIAAESDDYALPSCQYAYHYLESKNRLSEAQPWLDKANALKEKQQEDEQDRSCLNKQDKLIPHTLTEAEINNIREQLQTISDIKQAWIIQKATKHYPEKPAIAIALSLRIGWSWHDKNITETVGQLILSIPDSSIENLFIVPITGVTKKLGKRIRREGVQVV